MPMNATMPNKSPPATDSDAIRIILAIVHESGGRFEGSTRLYKAFWKAHDIYWRRHGRRMTNHPIVHMPHGPGINNAKELIQKLEKQKRLEKSRRLAWIHLVDIYELLPLGRVQINKDEQEAIREALSWLGEATATEASDRAHQESREWREAEESGSHGRELFYELDELTDIELVRMKQRQAEIEPLVR